MLQDGLGGYRPATSTTMRGEFEESAALFGLCWDGNGAPASPNRKYFAV